MTSQLTLNIHCYNTNINKNVLRNVTFLDCVVTSILNSKQHLFVYHSYVFRLPERSYQQSVYQNCKKNTNFAVMLYSLMMATLRWPKHVAEVHK